MLALEWLVSPVRWHWRTNFSCGSGCPLKVDFELDTGTCSHLSFQFWDFIWCKPMRHACCHSLWIFTDSPSMFWNSYSLGVFHPHSDTLLPSAVFSDPLVVYWMKTYHLRLGVPSSLTLCILSGSESLYLVPSTAGRSFSDDGWARYWPTCIVECH